MKKDIFEKELKTIATISKEFGAKKVLIFGSCLEDIETAQDIDIAVSGINPREFFNYYGKVAVAIDHEVDIVDLEDLREHLYKRVISKGRLIYEEGV